MIESTEANSTRSATSKIIPIQHIDAEGTVGGVELNKIIAGERNPGSETNNYLVAVPECNMTVIDLSGDADTAVSGGVPALLLGVYVSVVMSAHDVSIKDGSTEKLVLPASTAAGTNMDFHGSKFSTSIVVTPNVSSTGKIVVFWRAL